MSLCVMILEKDRMFIAGDSRTSIGSNGKKYTLGECQKIMNINGMIIFRSGNESITRYALDEFIKSRSSSMEKLQQLTNKHVQRFSHLSNIDLGDTRHAEFFVARMEGKTPVIYNSSSAIPDSITRIEGEASTMYLSIGGDEKTNAIVESLNGVLDNKALFETVYNAHSSETIGGTLTHYYLDKDTVIGYQSKIIDSRPIVFASDLIGLDAVNGLVITRSDNKAKASFNATDGLKFQKNTGTASLPTWSDMLSYDVTTGNLFIDGVINARDLKVNGASVLTVDGKLKSLAIETLEVGKNVLMGSGASISWGQVTNQPSAAQLGGVMANSTKLTHIDATGVYTGTLSADQIIAGKIKAEQIDTTNLAAQRIY